MSKAAVKTEHEASAAPAYKKRSRLKETWASIKTNPGAVFSIVIIIIYLLIQLAGFIFFTQKVAQAQSTLFQ